MSLPAGDDVRPSLLSLLLAVSCGDKDPTDDSRPTDDTATEAADDTEVGGPDDTATDDTATDDTATDDTATDDTGEPPVELAAVRTAVRAWFEADPSQGPRTRSDGLPEGRRLDAREGQPDRAGVPAATLAAFDLADRVRVANRGAVRLDEGVVGGFRVYALTTTTPGEDAYVEVFTEDDRLVDGARFLGARAPRWDAFEGRVRLSTLFTTVSGTTSEEGLSEADERAAAGQPPLDWSGDVRVTAGSITSDAGLMGEVDFGGLGLTDDQRRVAVASFDYLWGVHLRHTVSGSDPVLLGPNRQGTLTVGAFTRGTDGQTYLVADWNDIDDASFVLWFDVSTAPVTLRIVQFDG